MRGKPIVFWIQKLRHARTENVASVAIRVD